MVRLMPGGMGRNAWRLERREREGLDDRDEIAVEEKADGTDGRQTP